MSITQRRAPARAVTGPAGTPGAGTAVSYQPPVPPPPPDPGSPYYGPRNPIDPPYPGPPANLKTWSLTSVETISATILQNDADDSIVFLIDPPMYSGQLRSIWPIPQNAYYYVPEDFDLLDPLAMHSNPAQPELIYANYLGWYLCIGVMTYNTTTTGTGVIYNATIAVTQNNVATAWIGQQTPTQATFRPFETVVELQSLNPATGDTVSLAGFQTTSGSVNTNTTAGQYPTLNVIYAALPSAPPAWSTSLPVPANTAFSDTTQITGAFMNTNLRDTVNFLTYPPICRLQRNSSVQLASTTFPAGTAVPFNVATIDNWSAWNGTTRYTFPKAGLYFVYGQVNFLNDTTGTDRACGLRVNGGTTQWGSTETAANTVLGHISIACQMIRAAAADYVEVIGYSNATTVGGITIGGAASGTSKLIILWLAA